MVLKVFNLLLFIIFSTSLLSCERVSKKIEDRINEKIDKSINESLNKIDTLLKKRKLDSIKLNLDSSINKVKEKINKK